MNQFEIERSKLDILIRSGLMVAIAFTALALGTVEAWSIALFELIVLVLVLLWGAKAIIQKRLEISLPAPALILGAFVLFAVIQSVAINNAGEPSKSLSMDVE